MGWRQILVYTHRWLGTAGCGLFVIWFTSGIVMIYARMPELDPRERAARLAPLDFTTARVPPSTALEDRSAVTRLRIGMLQGRPVYRALAAGGWTTIFADTGERLATLSREQATVEAARFRRAPAASLRYDARIVEPDQWTLEMRALLPMHRIEVGDPDDTVVYVSERTGDVEMRATARERRIAYLGAILHWLYVTPLRRHTALWSQMIIWLSVAGCVLSLTGLAWGVMVGRRAPYTGVMRWHHYAGLIFGATTFTWIFSGLLSMDPWNWHPDTSPTRAQRDAVTGGPLRLDLVTVDNLRSVVAAMAAEGARELEIAQFRGDPHLAAEGRLRSLQHPARGSFARFDEHEIESAARDAMPGTPIVEAAWLREYDSYYSDRRGGRLQLPVLRVKFADSHRTWLYLDPARGAIVRKEERLTRLNRWLYHGFHSLDFPFLYARRPLWDVVMIVLSLGGLASAVTSLLPAWRRIRNLL